MLNLDAIRKDIDKVDEQIVRLFEARMQLTNQVAEYKLSTGKNVFDKEREEQKLTVLRAMVKEEFNVDSVEELFKQIMSMSRKLQYSIMNKQSKNKLLEEIDKIHTSKTTRVVFFGERGTYTEQAMFDYFGEDITNFNKDTFKGVMETVKEGMAEYGILPIENSSTGGISDIYDLLVEYDNVIVGEHILKIEHSLLGVEGGKKENLTRVYSHPQALMQCKQFFEKNPDIKLIEDLSTARAAKRIKEEGDITKGAIASKRAAKYYELEILEESIHSDEANATRFIIITNKKVYLKNATKVTICFELPHESGTLYNMLSHLIYNNLSMTKIESRPLKGKNWEYRFFIDIEGNIEDAAIKNALKGIEDEAIRMKVLGNY